MKAIARLVEESGMGVADLAAATGLDRKVIKAVVSGNYTASPVQRERLSAALGVPVEEIAWEHAVPVQHLRGNGPQCGRNT